MPFLLIILVLLLIEKVEYVKAEKAVQQSEQGIYLSPEYTNQLRGILAILVVITHLSSSFGENALTNLLDILGSYWVGVFFFLSGFGLMAQYQKRGKDYIKGFLWRRVIVSLLVPYVIFNVIYYVGYLLMGRQVTVGDMLYSWIDGHPLVSNSWYIIAILYFYLVFLISAWISGKRYWLVSLLCFGGSLAWMVICHGMGYGDWWFFACFPFNAGMIWPLWRKRLEPWFQRFFWIKEFCLLAVSVILYLAATILPKYIGMQTLIYLGCMQVSSVFFSIAIICLGMRLRFNGRCLATLGKCSMELYLIHGLFLTAFRSQILYLENALVFSLAVLAISVPTALLLHKGMKKIKQAMLKA